MSSFKIENIIETELIVIGAGAAGIRACYEASKNGIEDIVILSKGKILKSGSSFFPLVHGWGMQAVVPGLNPRDSQEKFYNEIIERGLGMADEKLVETLVTEAYPRVRDLQDLGLHFKEKEGRLEQIVGCFSKEKRALLAVDMKNIRETFKKMLVISKAKIIEDFMVLDLIIDDGVFVGLIGVNDDNRLVRINGRACILASGGGSNVYEHSLNSGESSGDTYGLALRAGLTLYNMEFIQFIFGIVHPKRLIFSERALYYDPDILNKKNKRFIENYLPAGVDYASVLKERIIHGPFSTRTISKYFDIAIFKEIRSDGRTEHGGVKVDLRNYWDANSRYELGKRWADVTDVWVKWLKDRHSIDVTANFLEIDHAAHAFNGGIETDETTRSAIPNLFVCGEAMAGPHGADRLGGNMMTSTQVFGARAGYYAAKELRELRISRGKVIYEKSGKANLKFVEDISPFSVDERGEDNYWELRKDVREKMWLYAHVVKSKDSLLMLKKYLEEIRENIDALAVKNETNLRKKYELLNLVTVGIVITTASLERKESRGSFYREDFPEMDSVFSKKLRIFLKNGELKVNYTNGESGGKNRIVIS